MSASRSRIRLLPAALIALAVVVLTAVYALRAVEGIPTVVSTVRGSAGDPAVIPFAVAVLWGVSAFLAIFGAVSLVLLLKASQLAKKTVPVFVWMGAPGGFLIQTALALICAFLLRRFPMPQPQESHSAI